MKSYLRGISLLLVVFLILSACSNETQLSNTQALTPNSIMPTKTSDLTSRYQYGGEINGAFFGCVQTLYMQKSGYIFTVDAQTGTAQSICQKTNCNHHTPQICDAFIGTPALLPNENILYYFSSEEEGLVLNSCGLHGENKQKILKVFDGTSNDIYEVSLVNDHIYCTKVTIDCSQIYDIDLEDKTVKILVNQEAKSGAFAHILDVVDGNLYYQVDYGDPTKSESPAPNGMGFYNFGFPFWYQHYSTNTALYRLQPGQNPVLLKDGLKGSSWSNGCNGCVYYTSEDQHTIYQYDLTTQTEYVAYTGEGSYEINNVTFDNVLSIQSKLENQQLPKEYILNVSDRTLSPFIVHRSSQDREFLDLNRYTVVSDYYFISARLLAENKKKWDEIIFAFVPKDTFKKSEWDWNDLILFPYYSY